MSKAPIGIPPRQSVSAEEFQQATSTRWLMWFFVGLAGILILWWFFFDQVVVTAKSWWARQYLDDMEERLQTEDYSVAARHLNDATRWGPDDPQVLRAAVKFVEKTGADPRLMLRFLTRLDQLNLLTPEELSKLGCMHVMLPDMVKAREIHDRFKEEDLNKRPALELLAAIQKAEGLHARSFLTQRQALLADPENPDSVLQLALLDAASGDPSLSGPGRDRLWPIARKGGEQAIPAINYLAAHHRHTREEFIDLLALTETLPNQDTPKIQTLRLTVLGGVLRLMPHERSKWINDELRRWNGRPPAMLPPLLEWLNKEKEHERVLLLVSDKTASSYTTLLPHYINALRGTSKWAQVKVLVASRIDPGFPRAQLRLWLAEAEYHLNPNDPSDSRHHITTVFDESGRGENLQVAVRAGEVAEELGFFDLARQCFEGAVGRHPEKALQLQLRVYDMALKELNGNAMLRSSEKLRDLRNTDVVFLDRVNYLRLLLGADLELALKALDDSRSIPERHITPDRQIALSFLRALAAYRVGKLAEVPTHLASVRQMETFPPGPRAVYAGLLDLVGQQAEAYQIAEGIRSTLLLPEERLFLQRALRATALRP